jgi:hypothetical protein
VRQLANYYLKKRMFILTDKPLKIDPRLGRPLPFLAFWFSNLFNFKDVKTIDKIALTLSYMALFVSIRDDMLDGKIESTGAHVCLANIYYNKYFQTFKGIIPPKSEFWFILSNCFNEWSKYESWDFSFTRSNNNNPFSNSFLRASSKYLVATTLPTIASIAILTENKDKIQRIGRFLRNYWIAFKIVDDIRDLEEDSRKPPNINHSSVIYYLMSKIGQIEKFGPQSITGIFLNTDSINSIYDTLEKYLIAAHNDALMLKSDELLEFIDTQTSYYVDERNRLLRRKSHFYDRLTKSILS